MNVLLAAGPESTTQFAITVQESGRPGTRCVGQRRIMVSLNRLQPTYRRLLLAGDTILSVTRCQHMGDPSPPFPHPVLSTDPDGLSASEAASATKHSPLPVPTAEETTLHHPREQPPKQSHQGQRAEDSIGEEAMVLLLSVFGVLILLTFHMARYFAQQWRTNAQAQQRPDPPVVGVRKRELANC